MSWPLVNLGSVIEFKAGFAFKSAEYIDTGIKLLRGDNIAQGILRWSGVRCWPEDNVAQLQDYMLEVNDVVLAMDRPWIQAGLKWSWLRVADLPSLLVQRVARLRSNKQLDQIFLRYIIGGQAFTDHVQSITTGVNVPHISGADIESFEFPLPPLPIQIRIAGILSAYDDLIAVNERRIAILEEMTRRVFENQLGKIKVQEISLGNIVNTQYGYTESAQTKPIGPKFLRGTDINKRSFIDWSKVPHCPISDKKLPKFALKIGDILVIRMADPGKIGIVEKEVDAVFASYLIRLTFKSNSAFPNVLFHALHCEPANSFMLNASTGATRKSISAKVLEETVVILPSVQDDIHQLERAIRQYRQSMNVFVEQNTNLRTTRDLLLPRLISGEIDVSELPETVAAE